MIKKVLSILLAIIAVFGLSVCAFGQVEPTAPTAPEDPEFFNFAEIDAKLKSVKEKILQVYPEDQQEKFWDVYNGIEIAVGLLKDSDYSYDRIKNDVHFYMLQLQSLETDVDKVINCDHICHSKCPFLSFIWRCYKAIVQSLFLNYTSYCKCGAVEFSTTVLID